MYKSVKLVPNKNIKEATSADFVSMENNRLILLASNNTFDKGDYFDVILEKGNILTFLKTCLEHSKENVVTFEICNKRTAIKRQYERTAVVLDVKGYDFIAQTINISAGGMQILTDKNLAENEIFDIEIDYLGKKIQVKYQILRINKDKNKFVVSGKFEDLEKENKIFILQQNLKNKIFGTRTSPKFIKMGLGGTNE